MKYFGLFKERKDVLDEFSLEESKAPLEDEIVFAWYAYEDYSGDALVIYFSHDGVLHEVNGSHCSCHGLEGQWEPEETSFAAIAMRPVECMDADAATYLRTLLAISGVAS